MTMDAAVDTAAPQPSASHQNSGRCGRNRSRARYSTIQNASVGHARPAACLIAEKFIASISPPGTWMGRVVTSYCHHRQAA